MKYNLLGAVSTIALGAAFGVGTPGAAEAALVCTGGGTLGGVCTETVTATWDKVQGSIANLTFDDWNSLLAPASPGFTETLHSVSYNATGQLSASFTLANTSGSQVISQVSDFGKFSLGPAAGLPSGFLSPSLFSLTTDLSPWFSVGYTVNANSTLTGIHGSINFGPSTGSSHSPAVLSTYTGAGTFGALFQVVGNFDAGTIGANGGTGVTTNAGVSINLTYTFTTAAIPPPPPPPSPTPEPASMALLGAGLAGLGVVRRRRKN